MNFWEPTTKVQARGGPDRRLNLHSRCAGRGNSSHFGEMSLADRMKMFGGTGATPGGGAQAAACPPSSHAAPRRTWGTPTVSVHDVIAKVAANDAGLQTVDLSSSAIFQVRLSRFLPSFLLSSSRILPLLAHFANPFLALERAGDEQQLTEGDIVKTLCNGALPAPLSMSPEMSR